MHWAIKMMWGKWASTHNASTISVAADADGLLLFAAGAIACLGCYCAFAKVYTKIRVPGYRVLHGIPASNYAHNEYFSGLDGFNVPKIKHYLIMGNFPSFHDMKSI